jgi:hypothetical protein
MVAGKFIAAKHNSPAGIDPDGLGLRVRAEAPSKITQTERQNK